MAKKGTRENGNYGRESRDEGFRQARDDLAVYTLVLVLHHTPIHSRLRISDNREKTREQPQLEAQAQIIQYLHQLDTSQPQCLVSRAPVSPKLVAHTAKHAVAVSPHV